MPRRKGQKNRPKSEISRANCRDRSGRREIEPSTINVAHSFHAPIADQLGVIAIAIQKGNEVPTVETFVLPRTDCYRADCASAARALTRCEDFSTVVLHVTKTIDDGIRYYLPGWRRKGWITRDGGQIAAKDAWQAIDNRIAMLNLCIMPVVASTNNLGRSLAQMAHDAAMNKFEEINTRALALASDRQELTPNFFEPSLN